MITPTLTTAARDRQRLLDRASLVIAKHHSSLLWLIALTIATLSVYASSLYYPFFWVDPIDIGLARDRSVWQILTTSQGYLYYRPLAFFLWKLLAALQGEFNPFGFHLVHLITHVTNVWLMFLLARRVLQHTFAAGIAALFFAWYPFSHQTVTWVISPQPQAALFMLLSAILYYDGRTQQMSLRPQLSNLPDRREIASSHPSTARDAAPLRTLLAMTDRRKIWLSVIVLALALPFQENAVSFGFVIAALEGFLTLRRFGDLRKVTGYPLAHIAVCLAFAALWFLIPKDPDSTLARFDQATGWYLLQGVIWPVAAAVGPWRAWFSALSNPAWLPLILTAPITLIALFVAYWRGRQLPVFFFGLIWFGVMTLPIWATRGFGYVGTSPRILYVAAGGAALIWAGLLTLDFRSARVNQGWKTASRVLVVLILAQSIAFLYTRKTLHDQTMPAIWDVIHTGQQAGDGIHLLYVNVPDQITPKWREFPVGFFRAVLMPVSVDLGQYAELQKSVRPQTQSLSVPSLAHLENYPYNVDIRGEVVDRAKLSAAIRAADEVYMTEYEPSGEIHIVYAGDVSYRQSDHYDAVFDHRLGVTMNRRMVGDQVIGIDFTLNCIGPFSPDETIFAHLVDLQGQLVAQADGDPLKGLFPLAECQPGEQIREFRLFRSPTMMGNSFKIGVYNRATEQRLNAVDAGGQPIPDNAVTFGPLAP